jgi:hypothetical protein
VTLRAFPNRTITDSEFLELRARLERDRAAWLQGLTDRHPQGLCGAQTEDGKILDQGYFLPVSRYMLDYYDA